MMNECEEAEDREMYKSKAYAICDLDQVPKDIENMKQFFTELSFNEIYVSSNPENKHLKTAFSKVLNRIKALQKEKFKVLVYVYYSGHGVIDGPTGIWCNSLNPKDQYFPIEKNI